MSLVLPFANEKVRVMRSTLVMMIHARLCSHRDAELQEKDANGTEATPNDIDQPKDQKEACKYVNCPMMKDILNHMKTCRAGNSCTLPSCIECNELMAHFKNCNNLECPVCEKLRYIAWKKAENRFCANSYEMITHYKTCAVISCALCKYMHRMKNAPPRFIDLNQKSREKSVARACQCRDRKCIHPICIKIRRVISHSKVCNRRSNSSAICREVFTFCCKHAVFCKEPHCVLADSFAK